MLVAEVDVAGHSLGRGLVDGGSGRFEEVAGGLKGVLAWGALCY